MKTRKLAGAAPLLILLTVLGMLAIAAAACGDNNDDSEPTATTASATTEATTAPTEAAGPTEDEDEDHEMAGEISLNAASATITVDGDTSDWDGIEAVGVPLEQIEIPEGSDWDAPNEVMDLDATLKVATDDTNIYVLVQVPDDYDFVADDAHLSAALGVMFRIDDAAAPHMGAADEDLEASLGKVDIWHWELDCAEGEVSGGGGVAGGDDATCNLDDEFALDPETREDDGGGDMANDAAENSLTGVWTHTASADGAGAPGSWVFEMSRPLDTGDSEDAQLVSGGEAFMAIAYWDPDESADGWTDNGHLQSAENGWIEVTLP